MEGVGRKRKSRFLLLILLLCLFLDGDVQHVVTGQKDRRMVTFERKKGSHLGGYSIRNHSWKKGHDIPSLCSFLKPFRAVQLCREKERHRKRERGIPQFVKPTQPWRISTFSPCLCTGWLISGAGYCQARKTQSECFLHVGAPTGGGTQKHVIIRFQAMLIPQTFHSYFTVRRE